MNIEKSPSQSCSRRRISAIIWSNQEALATFMRTDSLVSFGARPSFFTVKRALLRLAGATAIQVTGDYGRVIGSLHDRAILEAYARTRTWCPIENQFFEGFFARNGTGTYIDIGANIGLTTIPVARNPAVTCLAFEPEPANFAYLRENVRRHCRNGNVQLFPFALSDRDGRLQFQLSPNNKGDHRVRFECRDDVHGENAWPVIDVETKRLDDLQIHRTSTPLAAKVVAQGSELRILAGGRNVLARAGAMVVEFFPYLLSTTEPDWKSFFSFLNENFRSAAVVVGGEGKEPQWHAMDAIVREMQLLVQRAADNAFVYFHVFVRK